MKTTFLVAVACAAALLPAAPVLAQLPTDDVRTTVVSHNDLDLTQAKDVARLGLRIARAAEWACGNSSGSDLHGLNDARRCRALAIKHVANHANGNALVSASSATAGSGAQR